MASDSGTSSNRVRYRVEAVDYDIALGFVDPHGHGKAAVVKLLVENFRIAVQPTDTGAIGGVDREVQRHARCRQPRFDHGEQRLDPLPGFGGDWETGPLRRSPGRYILEVFALVRIEAIDLVPDFDNALSRSRINPKLQQHGIDVALLGVRILMRDVADMKDDIGL